ncbi:hypothetical protein CPB84DRAFT_1744211 [Gymnopilus junonius]|uniref:Prolyl 4-hydroxylase alpha subunit Fe(2+) 2OG dioxygenase domain-containing protein n=1 Tax=Gymnopilus junonius TaxID=109634 RepID=A0A9P5NY56_GYMJU|nr:hypothetical protein CPB84DRAFT_1744211 [Gymnopilus junonius]
MDISAPINITTPLFDGNSELAQAFLPDRDEVCMPSSPVDANEVSAFLLSDNDISAERNEKISKGSENEHSTPIKPTETRELTRGISVEGVDQEGKDGEDHSDNHDQVDGDDEDDDEDMTSELSEGDDLQDDLQDVLDNQHFSFTGTFYHAGLLTTAPNPCLHISGLGLVGLPLSDRDAKSIISCANLAPFGHGERTVIDKTVRDTWEIEPARITFANPQWDLYIKSSVVLEVCKSLGVAIGTNPPKSELYKLLLYEKGSHFLPHQEKQKECSRQLLLSFLPHTLVGQVVVSHASIIKTFDFAPNSLLSTALLAWYTDVKHEVTEVTSGYRLALSYNFIHDSSGNSPLPGLPQMDEPLASLRRILRKWMEGKYDNVPNLMAYLLDYQYSTANLRVGWKALKGVDAHRVAFLRTVAGELGFKVGLASLEHNVVGEADDYGEGYYRRGRHDYYDEYSDDRGTPDMLEVTDTSTKITGLVDLEGRVLISVGKISIDPDELIPKDPFEGVNPDKTEYEGYTGNAAGQLEHWYKRTVLVIMQEDSIDDICFFVEGVPYAFRKLKESAIPPTSEDRQWANRLTAKDGLLAKEHLVSLMDYALKWRDLTLWKNVMNMRSCTLQAIDVGALVRAWELFSFEAVRVSFEEILARSTQLPNRMEFLFSIRSTRLSLVPKGVRQNLVILYYRDGGDVPTIMNIIHQAGLESFKRIVMPNLLLKKDNYDFWIAFVKALRESRNMVLEREAERRQHPQQTPPVVDAAAEPTTDVTSDAPQQAPDGPVQTQAVDECLQAAASRWSDVPAAPVYYNYYSRSVPTQNQNKATKINRIVEAVEEAMLSPTWIFAEISSPTSSKLQMRSPLRKIGCGCGDCNMVDAFILNPKTTTTTFRLVQVRRIHLERHISQARDICTYETIRSGSPHGIQVTKLPDIVQAASWNGKQQAATVFLASFGSGTVIAQIMGPRFVDVQNAVAGVASFGSTNDVPAPHMAAGTSRVPQLPAASSSSTSSAVPSTSSATQPLPSQVAGKKRKNLVQLGPVIDLTGDDD